MKLCREDYSNQTSRSEEAGGLPLWMPPATVAGFHKPSPRLDSCRKDNSLDDQYVSICIIEDADGQCLSLPEPSPFSHSSISSISSKRQSATSKGARIDTPGTLSPVRIHNGIAVAGFVVGTTFEACLMGWMSCLHVQGAAKDPFLFIALLAWFVVLSWRGVFHSVLHHMDALLDMAPFGHVNRQMLYCYFNGGLALGLGMECTILHHVLRHKSQAAVLLMPPRETTMGMVSIVFGLGCLVLTVFRIHYTPRATNKKMVSPITTDASYGRIADQQDCARSMV